MPNKKKSVLQNFLQKSFDDNELLDKAVLLADEISDKKVQQKTSQKISTESDNNINVGDPVIIAESKEIPPPQEKISLSKKQLQIYDFLKTKEKQKFGFCSATFIEQEIGIKKPTIYKSLRILRKKKLINYQKYMKEGWQGFKYEIIENTNIYYKDGKKVYEDSPINNYLKSDNFESSEISKIENILQTHPELGYWRQLKLTPKQVQTWLRTAKCNLDIMIQYLKFFAFDMLDNEKEKQIKNPYAYFFRVIEKSGHYPKPTSYKSHQQKQIEDMEKMLAEKEKESKRIEELRQQNWKADQELNFQKMMSNPESDLYKKCFSKLNTFAKKLSGMGFEKSMKGAYMDLLEKDDEKIIAKQMLN